MSETTIKDGAGKGYQARVGSDNRLHVESVGQDITSAKACSGDSYNLNTGVLTLTSDSESAVFYFKNLGKNPVVVTAIFLGFGNTDGSGDLYSVIKKNPTAGTLVDAADDPAIVPINRNFTSSKTLDSTFKAGAEGLTITDGTIGITNVWNGIGRKVLSVGALVLAQGNSISISVTPPSGNTLMNMQVAMVMYEENTQWL